MSLEGKIEIYGVTDIGSVREHNEDAISCNESIGLAILADGMGGHRGGEVASAIAVSTIINTVNKRLDSSKNATTTDDESGYSVESLVVQGAIALANNKIYTAASSNTQYKGMGTTIVVLLFYDNRFTVAHVGDSRLYRLREGTLEQITRDHSLIQELVDRGFYNDEQARNSNNKNMVTRAIGIHERVEIDIHEDVAKVDDIYMLCSDGVTDMLTDELLLEILTDNSKNLEKAANELVRVSNEHGGKDNISVILARPMKPFPVQNNLFSKFFELFS